MKVKLNTENSNQDIEGLMCQSSCVSKNKEQQSATVEFHLQSKKMIYKDKLNTCKQDIPEQKLSKISDQASTTKEEVLKPYWSDQCKEKSLNLWLPTKTVLQDLESISSDKFLSSMVENSWFSTKFYCPQNLNLQKIYAQSSMSFHVDYMDYENTKIVSRRIRVYPTKEQKLVLRKWFGTSRFTYNQVVSYLKQPNTISSWGNLKTEVIHALPQWSKEIPYQIKSIAIRDACKAVSKAKLDYKKTGKFCEVKFRNKKSLDQSIYIPKSAISEKGIYHTLLGDLFVKENINTDHDSRLVYDHGRWFLCVLKNVTVNKVENQNRMVAIDPGIRTFATFYTNDCCGKIGLGDFGRIQRLCEHLDNLLSKIVLSKKSKLKSCKIWNMKRAANRMRLKISDLIDELHHKTALFLVLNFDIIVIPKFETQNMANRIGGRKLKSKSVRSMLTFAHYKFQQFLKHKANQYNKIVIHQNEAYTSKTCSWNGNIKWHLGGSKYIKDGSIIMDRDLNGARGIYLRALCEISPSVTAQVITDAKQYKI